MRTRITCTHIDFVKTTFRDLVTVYQYILLSSIQCQRVSFVLREQPILIYITINYVTITQITILTTTHIAPVPGRPGSLPWTDVLRLAGLDLPWLVQSLTGLTLQTDHLVVSRGPDTDDCPPPGAVVATRHRAVLPLTCPPSRQSERKI